VFRLSCWSINDVIYAFRFLRRVVVGNVADVSEEHEASEAWRVLPTTTRCKKTKKRKIYQHHLFFSLSLSLLAYYVLLFFIFPPFLSIFVLSFLPVFLFLSFFNPSSLTLLHLSRISFHISFFIFTFQHHLNRDSVPIIIIIILISKCDTNDDWLLPFTLMQKLLHVDGKFLLKLASFVWFSRIQTHVSPHTAQSVQLMKVFPVTTRSHPVSSLSFTLGV
jgi:hypothetical protein